MSTTTEPPVSQRPDFTPADVWRQKVLHTVTCPSGAVIRIRIPGIATLLEQGKLPDDLVGIALLDISHVDGAAGALRGMAGYKVIENDDGTERIEVDASIITDQEKRAAMLAEVKKLAGYQRHLVKEALVDPPLTLVEISSGDFPEDDLGMVAAIVGRLRATDARGVRIGVEPLDHWARFHREHGLPTNGECEGCLRLVAAASSIDVGAV